MRTATPYMITGLPRTRSAWLSVAARNQYTYCLHEPTRYFKSFQSLADSWNLDDPGYLIGVADHALGFQLPRILAEIEPKVLIVERGINEVERSVYKLLGPGADANLTHKFLDDLQAKLTANKHHPLVHCVKFEALNDYDTVIECLKWLIEPGFRDFMHVRHLMRMNIQVDPSTLTADALRTHNAWYRVP